MAFPDDGEASVAAALRLGIRGLTFTNPKAARGRLAGILAEGEGLS
ncbi:MAG: hypothetical protein J2P45_01755 [Candidatus Dormibacteraeota bacterium]|nr:hypothetical protein [Candidatus Dormibacteraeota bacterium]